MYLYGIAESLPRKRIGDGGGQDYHAPLCEAIPKGLVVIISYPNDHNMFTWNIFVKFCIIIGEE